MPNAPGQMSGVDGYLHEDVQHLDGGDGNRHQTAMPVMNQQAAAKRLRRQVVNAAGAVRNVSENHALTASELFKDICDHARVHEKALRKL